MFQDQSRSSIGQQHQQNRNHERELDQSLTLFRAHQYSVLCDDVTLIGNDPPVIGHNSGVTTDIGCVMVAVMESEPGSVGPLPFDVTLVTAAPFKQWKVTLTVAPAMTEPAGVPSFELSSAAWFAMVAIGPPAGGTDDATVTATGPLPVPAQTLSAVLC